MNKKDWEEAIKELEGFKKTAEDNLKESTNNLERINYTISSYKQKIETFK